MNAIKTKKGAKNLMNVLMVFACHECVDIAHMINPVLMEYAFQQLQNHHKFVEMVMNVTDQIMFVHGTIVETNVRFTEIVPLAKLPKTALLENIARMVHALTVLAVIIIEIVTMEWFANMEYALQSRVVREMKIANQKKRYVRKAYVFQVHNHVKLTLIVIAASFVTMASVPIAGTISSVLLNIFVVLMDVLKIDAMAILKQVVFARNMA